MPVLSSVDHIHVKRVYHTLQITVHHEGKSGQEPEAGTKAETTQQYFLPTCSAGLLSFRS